MTLHGWYTIAAHRPFVDDLAAGVLEAFAGAAPEALTETVILAPNRRAARALTEAFAGVGGAAPVLLPQIRPLGDLEEDEPPFEPGELGLDLPPAIGAMARRFDRVVLDPFFASTPLAYSITPAPRRGRRCCRCCRSGSRARW